MKGDGIVAHSYCMCSSSNPMQPMVIHVRRTGVEADESMTTSQTRKRNISALNRQQQHSWGSIRGCGCYRAARKADSLSSQSPLHQR
mmetsp:Transcript_79008/g.142543  ORF Transcript_79008/g.142543 Transcript_79008/m.142543 type:complete len:87 (-) Transcript_79008:1964-2224(-)